MDLSWESPSSNGGSDITHYSIEMADLDCDQYHKVGSAIATKFTITSLVEGKEYNIRVRALNVIGESEPTALAQPVIPREILGMKIHFFDFIYSFGHYVYNPAIPYSFRYMVVQQY